MDRCSKCVLPATTPKITFDEQGVCNYCKTYQPFPYEGEEAFLKLLDSHRGNKRYDCIANISGGRDSTYMILKLVKDYQMKVLAVNYDNPFTHPMAMENMKKLLRILNVDLVQFKLKNQIHERILRHNLKVWLKHPNPATVPLICIGCRLMWHEILRIARRHDIHLWVSGGNPLEYSSFKEVLLNIPDGTTFRFSSPSTIPGLVLGALKHYRYLTPRYLLPTIESYLFTNPYAPGSKILGHGIDRVEFFHYMQWKEEEIIPRITSELDWVYPETEGTWRFGCKVGCLKDYLYMKTLGMTEKDDLYSKMVREGLMIREDALAELEKVNGLHMDVVNEFLDMVK
jgi:hypothetical protein